MSEHVHFLDSWLNEMRHELPLAVNATEIVETLRIYRHRSRADRSRIWRVMRGGMEVYVIEHGHAVLDAAMSIYPPCDPRRGRRGILRREWWQ